MCKVVTGNNEERKIAANTPVEQKEYGFGISFRLPFEKVGNMVVFGGGFNYACQNE